MARILVIDDQEAIRALLRTMLENGGHEITEASNGREGFALYRQYPVDLVVTDIAMPEMNGLDLILELTRGFINAKVIAISGELAEELQAAKLLGVRQTLGKPFSMATLLSAVRYELAH